MFCCFSKKKNNKSGTQTPEPFLIKKYNLRSSQISTIAPTVGEPVRQLPRSSKSKFKPVYQSEPVSPVK
jgi:hypothetical protein